MINCAHGLSPGKQPSKSKEAEMIRTSEVAIRAVLLLASINVAFPFSKGQEVTPPTNAELAAITERGKLLYEYDQAAWHAKIGRAHV